MFNEKIVTMSLGSGGKGTSNFIKEYILKNFSNIYLDNMGDSAYLLLDGEIAFTTDSFVVIPEFFKGGDIGKLAVYGTCNDLAVSGAKPIFLSLALIIPEGYSILYLEKILFSIKCACEEIGVKIVCGDTKTVTSKELSGLIINTSGIGKVTKKLNDFSKINVGDKVILTSDIGRHGMAVMAERGGLNIDTEIISDCGNLYEIFDNVGYDSIVFARDATRGGVAAVLNEISEQSGLGIEIDENSIPIMDNVKYLCEIVGIDPLAVANEGVAVLIVKKEDERMVLKKLSGTKIAKKSVVVGCVTEGRKVILNTLAGGKRYVEMPSGELLPRIC